MWDCCSILLSGPGKIKTGARFFYPGGSRKGEKAYRSLLISYREWGPLPGAEQVFHQGEALFSGAAWGILQTEQERKPKPRTHANPNPVPSHGKEDFL